MEYGCPISLILPVTPNATKHASASSAGDAVVLVSFGKPFLKDVPGGLIQPREPLGGAPPDEAALVVEHVDALLVAAPAPGTKAVTGSIASDPRGRA